MLAAFSSFPPKKKKIRYTDRYERMRAYAHARARGCAHTHTQLRDLLASNRAADDEALAVARQEHADGGAEGEAGGEAEVGVPQHTQLISRYHR